MLVRRFFTRLPLPLLRAPSLLPTFRPHGPTQLPLTGAPRVHSRLFHHFPARLTDSPPAPKDSTSLPPDATRMQRLKHLFKSYGWYALGVYIVLSALDFGIAFALINVIGADYVERLTSSVKEFALGFIRTKPPEPGLDEIDAAPASGGHGLYAMLLLAYTVHKTLFLPVRVGLTAYLTPTLVGWLRQRGWAGGAGTIRAATHMRERLRSGGGRSRTTRQD